MIRNPAQLVAPGTRARLELEGGVTADVVRGATPGPIVWLWVARGAEDPSLQQAVGELRDALDPAALRGSVGLLVDGPSPPLGREAYPFTRVASQLQSDAAGVVLLSGPPRGHRAVPHAAADLDLPRDRRLAHALGLPIVAPTFFQAALHRMLLAAPVAWLLAGESERLERVVVDVTRTALGTLLHVLGLVPGDRRVQPRSTTVRTLVAVPAPTGGLVESTVELGTRVRRGEAIALVGEPGTFGRASLRAPVSGIVLYEHAGRVRGGAAAVIARVPPSAVLAAQTAPSDELGWCELVDLPDLGVVALPAKIDTGARTSALHVRACRLLERPARGKALYEIEIPAGGDRARMARVVVEVNEHTVVRDSGGHAERRPVIETRLRVGGRERRVRVSLTDRGDMRFPMLVGRTALDARTRIDPTRGLPGGTRRRRPPTK